MEDNLPPYLIYGILTAIAAFAGALGLGVSQWMSAGFRSSTRKMFHLLLSGILWPLRWGVTAIKEWRRVAVYRYRRITWDDLPQESKDNVTFHALSEHARDLIGLKDLPRDEKRRILDNLILPNLNDVQHDGTLSLLDDMGAITLSEYAQVTISLDNPYRDLHQDGMLLSLDIAFESPQNEIAFRVGEKIWFESHSWIVAGNIRQRGRMPSGTQLVTIWVTFLYFGWLHVFSETS